MSTTQWIRFKDDGQRERFLSQKIIFSAAEFIAKEDGEMKYKELIKACENVPWIPVEDYHLWINSTMIYTDKDNKYLKEKHEETFKKLEADPEATEEEKERIWRAIQEISRGY